MAKKYQIVVTQDSSQVLADNKKIKADWKATEGVIAQALAGQRKGAEAGGKARADAAEKASQDVARALAKESAAAEKAAAATARARVQASQKAAVDAQKAVDSERRADDKKVNDLLRGLDRVDRARTAAAEKAAREAAREAEAVGRKYKQSITETELARVISNRRIERANKERVDSALREAGLEQASFAETALSATGLGRALTAAGASLLAFETGSQIARTLAEAFADAQRAAHEMAADVLATEGALREIAFIKGLTHPDAASVTEHMDIRQASGLTGPEAMGFSEHLFNNLGTVRKAKLDDEERKKLEREGARLAARTGGGVTGVNAKADLLGLLPDYIPGEGLKAPQVLDTAVAVGDILQKGAGSETVMMTQMRKLLTTLVSENLAGSVRDPKMVAGLTALTSKLDPESAATIATQAIRQGREFYKMRHTPGTDKTQADFLKAADIGATDDPIQGLEKLFKHLDKNLNGRAVDEYLRANNFTDKTGNMRIKSLYEQWQNGNWKNIFDLAKEPVRPGLAEVRAREFERSDVGRSLIGDAKVAAAKARQGLKAVPRTLAGKDAEAQLIDEGLDTSAWGQVKQKLYGAMTLGTVSGRDVLINDRALQNSYKAAGQRPGLANPYALGPGDLLGGPALPVRAVAAALGPALQAVFGSNSEIIKRLDAIKASNEAMARQAAPGVPAVIREKPRNGQANSP